ncbi:MAG: NAD(P)-dependent oxidoreductase [Alphaproteobacteria bacterium]
MAQTMNETLAPPGRVVVIGSRGVIGHALVETLQNMKDGFAPVVAVSSGDVDLLAESAPDKLGALLRPDDAVIMLSGLTPDKGRDSATLIKNLVMARSVGAALKQVPPAHLVYMSSDAVYPFMPGVVSEATPAAPADLYGVMHLAREVMFRSLGLDAPLAVLRCTLVLSPRDTHNSYGPNRFRKQATEEGRIVLGGGGEETRDHVLVDDVARLVIEAVRARFDGTLNLVSGVSHSFHDVANMVADAMDDRPEIVTTDRTMPVTHRHFDSTRLTRAFPGFRFTSLDEAIGAVHKTLGLKT